MADELIHGPLPLGEGLVFLHRHDRVGANAAGVELGIMRVVVVMRPFPDARGCQDEQAPKRHHRIGELGVLQDRLVLVVMVDDEHPGDGKPGEHTANGFQPQR